MSGTILGAGDTLVNKKTGLGPYRTDILVGGKRLVNKWVEHIMSGGG